MKSIPFILLLVIIIFISSCNQNNSTSVEIEAETPVIQNTTKPKETSITPSTEPEISQETKDRLGQERREREIENTSKGRAPETPTPAVQVDYSQTPLKYVSKYTGEYPSAVNFLGNTALKTRIQMLVGKGGYDQILRLWKQETPIVTEGGYTFTTGQEGPEKSDLKAAILVDLEKDILFIALKGIHDSKPKIYAEDNAAVPAKMTNWVSNN